MFYTLKAEKLKRNYSFFSDVAPLFQYKINNSSLLNLELIGYNSHSGCYIDHLSTRVTRVTE
jgi:hypothetical protein